jgi:hypothetical protein
VPATPVRAAVDRRPHEEGVARGDVHRRRRVALLLVEPIPEEDLRKLRQPQREVDGARRAGQVERVQVGRPVVAGHGVLEERRHVVEVLRAREVRAQVPALPVAGVEEIRRHGLVARRLDEQMEVIERALGGIVRRPGQVEVEELPPSGGRSPREPSDR